MSKYEISADHEWANETQDQTAHQPIRVDAHDVTVILTTEPHETGGYGREKYTGHLVHDDDDTTALYFTKHRWKDNF